MSANPVSSFSWDLTVIIQHDCQPADKLRFVGSGLWVYICIMTPHTFFCYSSSLRVSHHSQCAPQQKHYCRQRWGSCRFCASVYCVSLQLGHGMKKRCFALQKNQIMIQFRSRFYWLNFGRFYQYCDVSLTSTIDMYLFQRHT